MQEYDQGMTVNSIQISGPVGGAEKQIPGLRNGQVERNPHGLGLQIVQEVVAFYNGTFEIKKSEFEYVVRAFWNCNTKVTLRHAIYYINGFSQVIFCIVMLRDI